jgi:hypothetical protein
MAPSHLRNSGGPTRSLVGLVTIQTETKRPVFPGRPRVQFRGKLSAVVKTGARARVLEVLLRRAGYRIALGRPPAPRAKDLSPENLQRVDCIYQLLGGTPTPALLRPGPWDLAFQGGLVVELDEELHFNRYRKSTLGPSWARGLPWREEYLTFTVEHEAACLAAAQWGKRWTNSSCERLFGAADLPGTFTSVGAPRWKQRALYDAMKDIAMLGNQNLRLARLATVDVIGGVRLGDALEERALVDLDGLRELLDRRTSSPGEGAPTK